MKSQQLLTRTIRVASRVDDGSPETGIPFVQLDEDTMQPYFSVVLTADTWRELGRPETITVTVEPGDRLNLEATR